MGAWPLKMCLRSYFARRLFCQCTNIFHKPSFVSSAFTLTRVTSLHGGPQHLLPLRLRQGEAFFSLRWWTGFILSLVQKKTEFIFFSASLPQPVSKNVFLLVWQTRCVSLGVNVYIYYCTCVKEQKWALLFVVFACWCFFSACYFTCEWFAVC